MCCVLIIPSLFFSRVDEVPPEAEKWGGLVKVGKGVEEKEKLWTNEMVNIGPGLPLRVFF